MITEGEKLTITKDYIRKLRLEGPRALTEYERALHSGGLVSGWGCVSGGRTNRVSRPTQARALACIEAEEEQGRRLQWYACLRAALEALGSTEGKTLNRVRHDREIARALQLYVIQRAGGETLCLMMSTARRVSSEHVRRLLREGIIAVKNEAEKEALFEKCGVLSQA